MLERKAVEKLNPGLEHKYAKEKALKQLAGKSKTDRKGIEIGKEADTSEFASSRAFFAKLQVTARTHRHADARAAQKHETAGPGNNRVDGPIVRCRTVGWTMGTGRTRSRRRRARRLRPRAMPSSCSGHGQNTTETGVGGRHVQMCCVAFGM